MNVDSTSPRGWALPLLGGLAAFQVIAAANLSAQGDPGQAAKTARSIPRSLVASAALEEAEIQWRNGETLPGTLSGADSDTVSWASELFTEPVKLQRGVIGRLDFARPEAGTTSALDGNVFAATFLDGSHVTGFVSEMTAETLSMVLGDATSATDFQRDQIVSLVRIGGKGIIASGPSALLAADSLTVRRIAKTPPTDGGDAAEPEKEAKDERPPLYLSPGGNVATLAFLNGTRHRMELPARSYVELGLRSEDVLEFSLLLTGGDGHEWVAVESWGDELVLVKRDQFVSAGMLDELANREARLRLGWDRDADRCTLFGADGAVLAELGRSDAPASDAPASADEEATQQTESGEDEDAEDGSEEEVLASANASFTVITTHGGDRGPQDGAKARSGVTLLNRGSGFLVERYSVREWNGKNPAPLIDGTTTIDTSAGETLVAEPLGSSAGGLDVRLPDGGQQTLAWDSIGAIRWNRKARSETNPADTRLWFAHGDLLQGNLLRATDQVAVLQTACAMEPVQIPLRHAQALILPDPGDSPSPPLDALDRLTAAKSELHGNLEATGASLPAFRPLGAMSAMALRAPDFTITRPLDGDDLGAGGRPPALLHVADADLLGADESWPVTLKTFSPENISFSWDATTVRALPTSRAHAIQFLNSETGDPGFSGSQWRVLGRQREDFARKDGSLTLPPDGAIGHSYLLHDGGFSFMMARESQTTSIRVRLFCQGTSTASDSLNFMIAHYGNRIYCGVEGTQPGQLTSQSSFTCEPDSAVEVKFVLTGDSVEMLIDGETGATVKLSEWTGKATGAGVILEAAAMWGNQIGPVILSAFSMHTSVSTVPPPPFSDNARREALLLPRLRRDIPPRHVLIGKNGDLIRGRVEAFLAEHVLLKLGLEQVRIPLDRLSAIVWVSAPPDDDEATPAPADGASDHVETATAGNQDEAANEKETPTGESGNENSGAAPVQWLDLTSGGRIGLQVDSWNEDVVTGTHPLLGQCTIPIDSVRQVALKAPSVSGGLGALANWRFEKTPDPVFPDGEQAGGGSSLVGKKAEDFTLPLLADGEFTLSAARGKVVVLDFWATWCAPCIRSLPPLIDALSAFPGDKVAFIAINQGESRQQVQRFLDVRGFKMSVAMDLDTTTGVKFGVEAIPCTVVIDTEGVISFINTGANPNAETNIVDAVNRALAAAADAPEADAPAGDAPEADAPAGDADTQAEPASQP